MPDYKTISVREDTWKDLSKLKLEKDYDSLDELISEEIDFSEI